MAQLSQPRVLEAAAHATCANALRPRGSLPRPGGGALLGQASHSARPPPPSDDGSGMYLSVRGQHRHELLDAPRPGFGSLGFLYAVEDRVPVRGIQRRKELSSALVAV
jgi:hypothetical protein